MLRGSADSCLTAGGGAAAGKFLETVPALLRLACAGDAATGGAGGFLPATTMSCINGY